MGEFRVHHVKFFEHTPCAIHCLAYDHGSNRLALSRSDGSIEIWAASEDWYKEKVLPPVPGSSVESLCWCQGRLFSAGLGGDLHEYDLLSWKTKHTVASNSGAIWCMTSNSSGTMIAVGTEDGCVVLFQVTDEAVEFHRSFVKQEGRILSITWHDPDDKIITGGVDNIRIWNIKSGQAIQRITLARDGWNTETIVWAVAVTQDFTIVSGDSRGKTTFWDGKTGTLIREYQSHKAAVLCLCLDPSDNTIFSCGIDPALVTFETGTTRDGKGKRIWVKSNVKQQHTNDVRAMTLGNNTVISGGVDTQLVVNNTVPKYGSAWRKMPAICQDQLVYTASTCGIIMLRYPTYLELWKLGSTVLTSNNDHELLPLQTEPKKLLQLKARNDQTIICAAISSNGKWIAYSDVDTLRVFKLDLMTENDTIVNVSVSRVRYLPTGCLASQCLQFSPDGSVLISASCEGTIQVISLSRETLELKHTLTMPTEKKECIHILSVSPCGNYMAAADHGSCVTVFQLRNGKIMCTLPQHKRQPIAMAFHPKNSLLAVSYTDQRIVEYDYEKKRYSDWSNRASEQWHPRWLQRNSKICRLFYNPRKPQQIMVHDEQLFCIIDKTEPFPSHDNNFLKKDMWWGEKQSEKRQSKTKHAFHPCHRYKYLVHLEMLREDFLLVVERPIQALLEKLPPPLKEKKFGT